MASYNLFCDYAILLARCNKVHESKEIYYALLRKYGYGSHSLANEPLPFVTVFDHDDEGDFTEYTPDKLEAAALLIKCVTGRIVDEPSTGEMFKRAMKLWPDWYLPVYFSLGENWFELVEDLMAKGESLAQPVLQAKFAADFRAKVVDFYARTNGGKPTELRGDAWQTTQGAERRKRMKCLVPNIELLKSLVSRIPG